MAQALESMQQVGLQPHIHRWICFPPNYEKAHTSEVSVACALDVLQPAVVVGWCGTNSISKKARVDTLLCCGFVCAQAIQSKMGDTRFTIRQIANCLGASRSRDATVSQDATFVALGYAGDLLYLKRLGRCDSGHVFVSEAPWIPKAKR